MKKALSLLLMLCMLVSTIAPTLVFAEAEPTNLAMGKSYEISQQFHQGGADVGWGWDDNAPAAYPDEDGISLTDGIYMPMEYTFSDPVWAGFNKNCPQYHEIGYSYITVDLESVSEITEVTMYVYKQTDVGISVPYLYELYLSDTGDDYYFANSFEINPNDVPDGLNVYAFGDTYKARFVQVRFCMYGWAFISELEVWGYAGEEVDEPVRDTYEGTMSVDENGNYSCKVPYGYTWEIDYIDRKIRGEDETICTTQDAYMACNPNWAITLYLGKLAGNTYYAKTDAIVCPGSASNAGITIGEDEIAVVVHSSASNPDAGYANWLSKVVAMSVKAGDLFEVDFDAMTVYSILPDSSSDEPLMPVNLALGKGWYGDTSSNSISGYKGDLTDGVVDYDGKYDRTLWYGADVRNEEDGVFTMYVDLGDVYDVSDICLFLWPAGYSGIMCPASVEFSVSDDGESFESVGGLSQFATNAPQWVSAYAGRSARYVRIDLKAGDTGVFWFVGEIEVYGVPAEPTEPEDPTPEEPTPMPNKVVVNVNENAVLTDGRTGFADGWGYVGTNDVLLIMNSQCQNKAMDVELNYDLGSVQRINSVALDFYHCANVMIGYPEGHVQIEYSTDGSVYQVLPYFDITPADVSTNSAGTVTTLCEFTTIDAAYLRLTFYVGSSTGVLGEAPADNKIFWEFASLAEITVGTEEPVDPVPPTPEEPDVPVVELPEDAIVLDYAGYVHDSYFEIVAGDNMTVGELTALGIGSSKDMNYFVVAVVGADNIIDEIYTTLGRPDGVKTDVVCPEGGYLIALNANKAGYEPLANANVGDMIVLYNVDVDSFRGKEGSIALENAGFAITAAPEEPVDPVPPTPEEPEEPTPEIPEEALKIDISHVNAYTWGAYNEMIIYGEGQNSLSKLGYDCTWWLAIKVENVGGVYTVTEIEGVGETKDMVAPADGFLVYCFSNDAESYKAAEQLGKGATLYYANFDWTQGAASETPIGQLYFIPVTYGENVALGKDVLNADKRGSYYAGLTDGVAVNGLTYNAADWFGFYWNPGMDLEGNLNNNTNAIYGIANPTVDLGGLYEINSVRLNLFTGNTSGICAPESVKLLVSAGGDYEEIDIVSFDWPESGTSKVEWVEFILPAGISAQYVCLEMVMRTTFVFINEIEVYGTEAPACTHSNVGCERYVTCYSEGYEREYCVDCGEELSYNVLAPVAHEYVKGSCIYCGKNENGSLTLSVGDVTALVGDTFSVDIMVEYTDGFCYLNVTPIYDESVLELVSIENSGMFDNFMFGRNCVWADYQNHAGYGSLATMTFRVKEDAAEGSYVIGVVINECSDENENDVVFEAINGTLTVIDFVYGDCNGDGVVNGKDVTRLMRYLAYFDPATGESEIDIARGADCNGDGVINGKDATRLLRYLAYFDPATGESDITLGK